MVAVHEVLEFLLFRFVLSTGLTSSTHIVGILL